MTESRAWVAEELTYGQLGDARLNKRLEQLVGALAAKPNASVPEACGSCATTKTLLKIARRWPG